MKRLPLIAGNWKMNTTVEEAIHLTREMKDALDPITGVEKVICPPFVSLVAVKEIIRGSSIKLGAQNMYFRDKGAYTGEISSSMLSGLCDYVILGHSERRNYFGETNELINEKLGAALKSNLAPILCVGESLEENEAGKTEEVITRQVEAALRGLDSLTELVIAYEPVWAIGTGRAATPRQAGETIALIRHTLDRVLGGECARESRILYGGSVTGDNIADFAIETEIDGALVGGASLKSQEFVAIVARCADIKNKLR